VVRLLVLLAVLFAFGGCHRRDLTDGRYQGMVELEQTDLAFEITGRIATLEAKTGTEVKKGQVVARLDDSLDRATRDVRAHELDGAKADLALLQAGTRVEDIRGARAELEAMQANEAVIAKEVDREQHLLDTGATTGSRLDELHAQLAKARGDRQAQQQKVEAMARGARAEELLRAEARVAQAQDAVVVADRQLDKHVLIAPIDGAVLDVYPEVGEVLQSGIAVLSIVDRTRPYADVFVPVADAPKIKLGTPIAIAVEGDPREVPGVVERMYPQLEFTPRFVYSPRERPNLLMRVRVRLDDKERRLHAGMPAYGRLAP
jgi:HlyD family secretion protein